MEHNDLALDQLQGDRRTKQAIVYTICGVTALFSMTVCVLVLRGMAIPEALDRLITFIVGNVTGMLTKTGVERVLAPGEAVPVTNADGEAIKTQETTPDEEANDPAPNSQTPSGLSKVIIRKP